MQVQAGDITVLLVRWREGDSAALDRLLLLIRSELHRLARCHLRREGKNRTMQPSSLVQEAFVRMLPHRNVGWRNQARFFAVASQVMRHVPVDYARQRRRLKRSGAAVRIPVGAGVILSPGQVEQIVAADPALDRLSTVDERVFEMRVFGGLNVEETVEALGVAQNTVIRGWNFARAWLRRELGGARATKYGYGAVAAD